MAVSAGATAGAALPTYSMKRPSECGQGAGLEGPLCLMVDGPTRALVCGLVSGEWRAGREAVALIPPSTGGLEGST